MSTHGQFQDGLNGGAMKAFFAWVAVGFSKLGINTWSDVAAVLAALYSLLLIIEWFRKHLKARKNEQSSAG